MRLVQVPSVGARHKPHTKTPHVKRRVFVWLFLTVFTVSEIGLWFRPLPPAAIDVTVPTSIAPSEVSLSWPAEGQAAVSAERFSFLASNAPQSSVSTASMAKLLTALCIVQKKPLTAMQSGPVITMQQADVDRYQQELDQGGSYLAISLGEDLTERQLLEAMLLPSANNIANTAAIWAFGSLPAYKSFAAEYVAKHGLTSTVVGPDASGFDPATKSTTGDLIKLAKLALAEPAIVAVAKQQTATFATAGTVENRNYLLSNGVLTGLKTGMNDGNSGGFVFTANVTSGTSAHVLTGAIVNDTDSLAAVRDAETLAKSASDDFEVITLAKGTRLGTIRTAWGSTAQLVTEHALSVTRWKANRGYYYDKILSTNGVTSAKVGDIYLKTDGGHDQTAIVQSTVVAKPSVWWRLTTLR